MQFIQGLAGMIFGQELARRLEKPGAYNIFNHTYSEIHEDYTAMIDALIMDPDNGIPGPLMIMSGRRRIPHVGQHYYTTRAPDGVPQFVRDMAYVGLIKTIDRFSQPPGRTYYTIWEPVWVFSHMVRIRWAVGESPIDQFMQIINEQEEGQLVTHRINASTYNPTVYRMAVEHPTDMRPYQATTLEYILGVYRLIQRGVFLFSGPRGSGKTTTALQIKRVLEQEYPTVNVRLITNLDPSQSGLDIFDMVVRHANVMNPHVIIINEITTHMKNAASAVVEKQDQLYRHTANITTFHDTLDTLASVRYVVVILTTEHSVETIWGNQNYKSFIRPGRVHGLVRMTEDSVAIEANRLGDRPVLNELTDRQLFEEARLD